MTENNTTKIKNTTLERIAIRIALFFSYGPATDKEEKEMRKLTSLGYIHYGDYKKWRDLYYWYMYSKTGVEQESYAHARAYLQQQTAEKDMQEIRKEQGK